MGRLGTVLEAFWGRLGGIFLAPWGRLFFGVDSGVILDAILDHFGVDFGSNFRPLRGDEDDDDDDDGDGRTQNAPRRPQEAPKTPEDAPRPSVEP